MPQVAATENFSSTACLVKTTASSVNNAIATAMQISSRARSARLYFRTSSGVRDSKTAGVGPVCEATFTRVVSRGVYPMHEATFSRLAASVREITRYAVRTTTYRPKRNTKNISYHLMWRNSKDG